MSRGIWSPLHNMQSDSLQNLCHQLWSGQQCLHLFWQQVPHSFIHLRVLYHDLRSPLHNMQSDSLQNLCHQLWSGQQCLHLFWQQVPHSFIHLRALYHDLRSPLHNMQLYWMLKLLTKLFANIQPKCMHVFKHSSPSFKSFMLGLWKIIYKSMFWLQLNTLPYMRIKLCVIKWLMHMCFWQIPNRWRMLDVQISIRFGL